MAPPAINATIFPYPVFNAAHCKVTNLCEVMVHVDAVHVVVEEIPDGHGEVVVAVNDGELAQDAPHSLHGPGAVLGAVWSPGHMLRPG